MPNGQNPKLYAPADLAMAIFAQQTVVQSTYAEIAAMATSAARQHSRAVHIGLCALAGLALSAPVTAQSVVATIGAGNRPVATAVNPVTNKIYVANTGSNSVTVIDGASNSTTTVATGARPTAIAIDSVRNNIYVANRQGHSVTVIDGLTQGKATVAVGSFPVGLAVNPVTNRV